MADPRFVENGRKGGLKGGKATGQSKNRMKHLTPEERSQKMRELGKKRYEKHVSKEHE